SDTEKLSMKLVTRRLHKVNESLGNVANVNKSTPLPTPSYNEYFPLLNRVQRHQVDHKVEPHPARQTKPGCISNGGPAEAVRHQLPCIFLCCEAGFGIACEWSCSRRLVQYFAVAGAVDRTRAG